MIDSINRLEEDAGKLVRAGTGHRGEGHRGEAIEFKLIVFMTFWIFLLGAIVMRFSGRRPKIFGIEAPSRREPRRPLLGEAWAMASASIAYAFNMK